MIVLVATAGCSGVPPAPGPSPSASPSAPPSPLGDINAPLPSPMPDVLGRVNGHPIVARQIAPLARNLLDKSKDPDADKPGAVRQALRDYIDRELLFQEALAQGVKADDDAVRLLYDQARVNHPDDKEWAASLARLGFDPQGYRDEIRIQATVKALLLSVAETMKITDAEARARYDAAPAAFPPPEGKEAGFDSVKEQVKATLLEEKRGNLVGDLVRTLRARARIETYI
jgi:hypothetical protein